MVMRAVGLTQEGACLIDTCMAHRFEGERSIPLLQVTTTVNSHYIAVRAIVAPFTNMNARVDDCRKKVHKLRKEFDTAIIVDIRKEGECSVSLSVQLSYVSSIWCSPGRQERKCFSKTRSHVITAALRPRCYLESKPGLHARNANFSVRDFLVLAAYRF